MDSVWRIAAFAAAMLYLCFVQFYGTSCGIQWILLGQLGAVCEAE